MYIGTLLMGVEYDKIVVSFVCFFPYYLLVGPFILYEIGSVVNTEYFHNKSTRIKFT